MRDWFDLRSWFVRYTSARYLSALDERLKPLPREHRKRVRQEIEEQQRSIYEGNKGWIMDRASKSHLMLTSLVLATYRILLPLVESREAAIDNIRYAFAARAKGSVRLGLYMFLRMGISPLAPGKAFDQISKSFRRRGERAMGGSFIYVQDVQDGERSFVNIRRCFFNDFFRAEGAPELTGIFCSMDDLWAEELKKKKYGVRFERPTTLALGGDMCRFQFTKRGGDQGDAE